MPVASIQKPSLASTKGRVPVRRFQPKTSVSCEAMLVDGNDEQFRHTLFLSRLLVDRLIMFLEVVAREIGLSGNQYVILLAIAHSQGKGGAAIRDIARYALMASTHVTTQVGALIRKGLVLKKPNSEDGRSVLLSLAPKGEKAMDTISPLRQEFNDAFFEGVSRRALLAASSFLEQVTANSEQSLPLLQRPELKVKSQRRPRNTNQGATQ